jgi:phosphoribosylglycinamide formyltransferase-1
LLSVPKVMPLCVHPSLLPFYRGASPIERTLINGEKETGVTIHFVDEGVDTGPIILQRRISIKSDDTLESLEARVHAVEHELYPEAVRLFLEGKLNIEGSKVYVRRDGA